jgi:hypothetical protein
MLIVEDTAMTVKWRTGMQSLFLDFNYTPAPPEEGVYCFLYPHSTGGGILFYHCPSQDIFRRIFLSNYWWQKSDIWSQPSYSYPISWEAFFDPSDSYFLFADLVGFYTHWTYMRGYHKWALANSSSCLVWLKTNNNFSFISHILM